VPFTAIRFHRLAWLPSPHLDYYQRNAEIYESESRESFTAHTLNAPDEPFGAACPDHCSAAGLRWLVPVDHPKLVDVEWIHACHSSPRYATETISTSLSPRAVLGTRQAHAPTVSSWARPIFAVHRSLAARHRRMVRHVDRKRQSVLRIPATATDVTGV
jgi:hypothetical protein